MGRIKQFGVLAGFVVLALIFGVIALAGFLMFLAHRELSESTGTVDFLKVLILMLGGLGGFIHSADCVSRAIKRLRR